MKRPSAPLLAAPVLAAVLLLAACGSSTPTPGGGMTSPASSSAATTLAAPVPEVPPATGPVTGQGTVIETPGGVAELCLGPVMESYPPQCHGVPLTGWDWETTGPHEEAALDGKVTRWSTYAVTGTFDGHTMTVTGSVPLALYDTVAEPSPRPMAPPDLTAEQWARVESGVRLLPGLLTSTREGDTGPVYVDVVHDDGTLQAWADAGFGAGVVRVTSALR
jgi:hypothetical protein